MTFLPPRWATDSLMDRLLCRVERHGDCWLWDGALKPTGYAQMCAFGKHVQAHRVAYMVFKGDIPDGLHVLHSCDVRNCVNPEHLSLGTQLDNMRDMMAKGRHVAPKGEQSSSARLTEKQVAFVRASDQPGAALARRLGVSKSTIYAIRSGLTWRCLDAASA